MNARVLGILTTVIVLGVAVVAAALLHLDGTGPALILFWILFCVLSEFFWVRTLSGDSVHSLAATVKLSTLVILGPGPALPAIWLSTLTGNLLFRRTAWYKALYNASQLTVAGAIAAAVYATLGGAPLDTHRDASSMGGVPGVATALASRGFLIALLVSGLTYILVNNTLMAWLMSTVTGRRMATLWRENCLYPEEVQSSAALVLMTPLLILLYGTLGIPGLFILLGCLGFVRAANRLYVKLVNMQDGMVRGERMAAMGELAEEIGVTLGDYLKDLKQLSATFATRAERRGGEKTVRSAAVILQNVSQMATLVEGLAAFSHRETRRESTDLNALIQRAIEFVRPQNRFDGIEFEFAPDPALPEVQLDPGQIQQVLLNLFTNGADALREVERERRTIHVETHRDEKADRILVQVTDNGPGIPKESLPRIFEPHFTTKPTGHGFGLSTAFRIAANHRGRIGATTLPGGGAQFELELPAA